MLFPRRAMPRVPRGPLRAQSRRFDAVSGLTVYVVLLFAVPSDRTIAQLGGAGSPAVLLGVCGLVWWGWHQLARANPSVEASARPVRLALAVFIAAVLVSYIVAMLSPRPGVEVNAADLGVVRTMSYAGIMLIASDGIRNEARFRIFLRRLSFAGALLAALGLAQFVTGASFVDSLVIPGLSTTQDFSAVQGRNGFARAAGTATNPLEYAFVLSMLFPIALTLAISDTGRSRLRRWAPAVLIALALLLSASRSGILGLVAGLVILVPTWPRVVRWRALVVSVVGVTGVYLLVPGMIGTLRYLFTNIADDPSARSRTNSYDLALSFIERNPFFGRGFGTFLPQYRILDNQYLGTAIELGLIGLAALLALLVVSIVVPIRARRLLAGELPRQLAQSLGASAFAGTVLMYTFDVFSFRMSVGVLVLVIGLCGACWRLARRARDRAPLARTGRKLPHAPGGSTGVEAVGLTVPGDEGAGGDDTPVAHGDAGKDGGARADPGAGADMHGRGSGFTRALQRVRRVVRSREEHDVHGEVGVLADGDGAEAVEEHAAIEERAPLYMDVRAAEKAVRRDADVINVDSGEAEEPPADLLRNDG